MPAVKSSGSKTPASLDVEEDLYATVSGDAAATYVLAVDTHNLVNDETVILRIYTKVRAADSEQLAYVAVYKHAQGEPNKYSVPVPVPYTGTADSLTATIEQSGGTLRAFLWSLNTL